MPTAPLNEREARAWRNFHALRTLLTAELTRDLTASSGLTEADYAVMVHLSEAPGHRLRARDLGAALGWERSRLSHQLSRMEARGTTTRLPCDDDARGFDVLLTSAGLRAITAAAPQHLARVRHCFIDLLTPAQLDALSEIAETVTDHLAAEHGAGAD